MQEISKKNDQLISQKNDIAIKIQTVERESEIIRDERESMERIKQIEQEKHKNALTKQVSEAQEDYTKTQ